jgi:hypothetical protein
MSQSHPRTTAILIDEFDASHFERAADGEIVGGRHGGVTLGELRTPNSSQADG